MALSVTPAVAAADPAVPDALWPFLEAHCVECHDDVVAKGGLDLYGLEAQMAGAGAVATWTRIFDRVAHGEMPPAKKPRPEPAAVEAFLGTLDEPLFEADRALREVTHRRMNRVEYEHTMHDLLGIDVPLKEFLPEDQSAGGFDTNGAALAVSAELFEGYLKAARTALDHAIVLHERPVEQAVTVDSLKEVEPYLGKQYALVDGRVAVFLSNATDYSKVSTRAHRTPVRGRYRFRFPVAAEYSDAPLVFSVVASDFDRTGSTVVPLGYFEANPQPRVIEVEAVLDAGFAIQFFVHGLPGYLKNPTDGSHPGVGFGPVEIVGPITGTWPPESHARLLGDIDLEAATAADLRPVLAALMDRAYRRPVGEAEIDRKLALVRARLDAGRPVVESLRVGLEAVLCSPDFLYRSEGEAIDDLALASRLSYFLWSSLPDAELRDLAERGALAEPGVLAAQVDRMVADPRGARFVEHFTDQWLNLQDIDATVPDRKLYPGFDELLKSSMVWEARAFFAELLRENHDLAAFIDSDFVMVNQRLAEHYGIGGIEGLAVRKTPVPAGSPRGGVMTQAALLKVTANGTNTSPVVRGVWVLENLLGQHVPPPPPNISGIEPDIREATTIREQLALHSNEQSCAACHQHIDPPGFALEAFDPVGAYRENYLQFVVSNAEKGWGRVAAGKPVDASGILPGGETFGSIVQFKELLLADRERFARCLAGRLATYGLGRELGFSDRGAIDTIVRETAAQGDGFRTLLRELITSPLFLQP